MSIEPTSQRRHAAARSRTATALLSVGGFLGIIGSLAASRTAGSTSTASTPASNVPAAPAPASTTPTTHAGRAAPNGDDAPPPAVVPVAPAPVASTAPPASTNQWNYGGTPATTFNQQPVTRSHASR
jgi:hypothetical protein